MGSCGCGVFGGGGDDVGVCDMVKKNEMVIMEVVKKGGVVGVWYKKW